MTRAPRRLVLIGHPVAHSLSPVMQRAALRAAGIDASYELCDVAPADLASTMRRLGVAGVAGNVTVPHKEAVFRLCTRASAIARRVGAVNTFWAEDEALVGDNTDVGGFSNAVTRLRGARLEGSRVALLGAGGAAAAVLAAVSEWGGCTVRVWNRTPSRAEALVARFPGVAVRASSAADAVIGATLVVNATTIGLADDAMPTAPDVLPSGADVMDLVYRRGETAWVRAVRARGHRAADGLVMLVEQGALAFERWFHRPADRAAMWNAVGS